MKFLIWAAWFVTCFTLFGLWANGKIHTIENRSLDRILAASWATFTIATALAISLWGE